VTPDAQPGLPPPDRSGPANHADEQSTAFTAYEIHPDSGMPIVAAPRQRDWMEQTGGRGAYRCLPLLIANQAGWFVLCPAGLRARWDGRPWLDAVHIEFDGTPDSRVTSHFGDGIITFSLPYLFRTPPGVNLWVKGPSNMVKDGVQPLEGLVESDWCPATFTMNWKLTRPNHWVRFDRSEPICMIVPAQRGLAENLVPVRQPLRENTAILDAYTRWSAGRHQFLASLRNHEPAAVARSWQKDYFRGLDSQGRRVPGHENRLGLREFRQG